MLPRSIWLVGLLAAFAGCGSSGSSESSCAVDRGELPATTDVELLANVGPALLMHELVFGRKVTRDLADRIVTQFLP